MKILIVNTYYYPEIIGGAEVSIKKLAEQLVNNGHNVYVFANGDKKLEIINGVTIYRKRIVRNFNNRFINNLYRKVASINNIIIKRELCEVIKKIKPDVIHVNNIYYISPVIWKIAKKLRIPVVQTLRDYYLMCPKSTLLCKNKICQKEMKICKIYRVLNEKKFRNVDFITAPSKATLNLFKSNNLIGENSKYIYNAIDKNKSFKFQKIEKNSGKIKYIYLGSLVEYKGIINLLNVFIKIKNKNIELHIAGKGLEKDKVEEYTKLDNRIIYHGQLDEESVNKLLQSCDVLVAPSVWLEPFGRIIIDAYKNGLPVIASNLGGLSEIVEHKKTGILINPFKLDELGEAILYMNSRERIAEMSGACIKKVDDFSLQKQVLEFEKVYYKVCKNSKELKEKNV